MKRVKKERDTRRRRNVFFEYNLLKGCWKKEEKQDFSRFNHVDNSTIFVLYFHLIFSPSFSPNLSLPIFFSFLHFSLCLFLARIKFHLRFLLTHQLDLRKRVILNDFWIEISSPSLTSTIPFFWHKTEALHSSILSIGFTSSYSQYSYMCSFK